MLVSSCRVATTTVDLLVVVNDQVQQTHHHLAGREGGREGGRERKGKVKGWGRGRKGKGR